MSSLLAFQRARENVQVALPFDLSALIAGWSEIRAAMLKQVPAQFTRDEWAYLVSSLDAENLRRPFQQSFGNCCDAPGAPDLFARPRGPVGLWLPNNVSLLGPLMLVIVSLAGSRLRMKAGSRSEDLTGAFLQFARDHVGDGPLASYLRDCRHEVFSSDDPRNREIAERSAVRIVFGSTEAAAAIHELPHPVDSIAISFTDRRSEAWLEVDRTDDGTLRDLIKVFAIYGQAGCTSPSRVILLNASRTEALNLRDRLLSLWPAVIRRRPEMNVASDNVRAWQLARAAGWESELVADNRAVLSVGEYARSFFPSLMELRIIPATVDEARANLPENIQTIGHALGDPHSSRWLDLLSGSRVARFVPLATMHHFDTVWDGQDFFAQLFTYTRVAP
ncbi:MAG TPA: acyl-CoA reductase [Terriglobales bacterium]|nr:acyl-CoA reductase [Terriglobales bacterium]